MALLVPDDLWQAFEFLLPPERLKLNGEPPRAPDRPALAGVVFGLRADLQCSAKAAELGSCGKTCWRRLGERHFAGVWTSLHWALLERLNDAGQLDWSRAAFDRASIAAYKRVLRPGRTRPITVRRAPSATLSPAPVYIARQRTE